MTSKPGINSVQTKSFAENGVTHRLYICSLISKIYSLRIGRMHCMQMSVLKICRRSRSFIRSLAYSLTLVPSLARSLALLTQNDIYRKCIYIYTLLHLTFACKFRCSLRFRLSMSHIDIFRTSVFFAFLSHLCNVLRSPFSLLVYARAVRTFSHCRHFMVSSCAIVHLALVNYL